MRNPEDSAYELQPERKVLILACKNRGSVFALRPCSPEAPGLLASFAGILVFAVLQAAAVGQESHGEGQVETPQVMQKYGNLPLSFEPNRGQTNAQVRFSSRGAGYSIFLTNAQAVLSFSPHRDKPKMLSKERMVNPRNGRAGNIVENAPVTDPIASTDVIEMQLAGGQPEVVVAGEDPLPGTTNYFVGSDPAQWHTGIPTYSKVRYSGVYPGVDLVYYGNKQQLEYDFVIAPGGDPGCIRLHFRRTRKMVLDDGGNLVIQMKTGRVAFRKPLVYQSVGGQQKRIDGAFRLTAHNTVRFRIGAYDHAKPLIIDPILTYSTYLDGPIGDSAAVSMAVDAEGNAFIAGMCNSDFPTTPGAFQPAAGYPDSGNLSVCVSRLSSDGSSLVYSTFLEGTSAFVFPTALTIDSDDNAYIVGYTTETDFPTTKGAFQQTNPTGVRTGFVTKLNNTGTTLAYSTYIGGTKSTNPTNPGLPQNAVYGVAVDGSGDAFVTGLTYSSDFPTTSGTFQPTFPAGNTNGTAFVTEFNSTGTGLVYGTFLGGNAYETGESIVVDSAGEAIVGGNTESLNFPITPGAFQSKNKAEPLDNGTLGNSFVTKINASGNGLVFSTFLGGTDSEQLSAVAQDSAGSIYVTGTTFSKDFPVTSGAYQTSETGGWNGFITKMKSDGTALQYSTYLGGSLLQTPVGIAVDSSGNAYVTGYTLSLDFPVTPGAFETNLYSGDVSAESGGFLTEINPSGSSLVYSTFLCGSGDMTGYGGDDPESIALDSSGNVYVAGAASSADFPTTPGAYMTQLEADRGVVPSIYGASSAFVTKFNNSEMKSLPLPAVSVEASPNPQLPLHSVMYTAHVAPPAGGVTPTGLIGFDLDGYIWSTATLDATGSASYTSPSSAMILGPNSMNVIYLGDANNAPNSAGLIEDIALYPTATSFAVSSNSVAYGAPLTLSATVTSIPPTPVPTGTVTFIDSFEYFPTITVPLNASGVATTTISNLPVGTSTIIAAYDENDNLHATSQASASVTILPPPAPSIPTFSPPPGSYSEAQSVALSDGTAGVTICYTTDGTQPAALCQPPLGSTTVYAQPIPVSQTTTINAIAVAGNTTPSAVGTGVFIFGGLPPAFTVTATPVTVTPGETTGNTSSITVTPTGGFTGTVTLSAIVTTSPSGAQYPPFLSLGSTSPFTFTGPNPKTATMTVSTTAATSAMAVPEHRTAPWYHPAGSVTLACILLFGIPRRFRRARIALGALILLVTFAGGMLACGGGGSTGGGGAGGGGNPGTTPGTYIITVTGKSGAITETNTVTLTVD